MRKREKEKESEQQGRDGWGTVRRDGGEGRGARVFLVQGTRSRTRTYKTYVENCWDVISHGSQQRRYNILKSMYASSCLQYLSAIYTCIDIYIRVSCNIRAQRGS